MVQLKHLLELFINYEYYRLYTWKIINNNVNEDIIYTANSKQQNHTCIVKEKVVVKPNDCLNIDE